MSTPSWTWPGIRREGNLRRALLVAGCLAQRYKAEEILDEIPQGGRHPLGTTSYEENCLEGAWMRCWQEGARYPSFPVFTS